MASSSAPTCTQRPSTRKGGTQQLSPTHRYCSIPLIWGRCPQGIISLCQSCIKVVNFLWLWLRLKVNLQQTSWPSCGGMWRTSTKRRKTRKYQARCQTIPPKKSKALSKLWFFLRCLYIFGKCDILHFWSRCFFSEVSCAWNLELVESKSNGSFGGSNNCDVCWPWMPSPNLIWYNCCVPRVQDQTPQDQQETTALENLVFFSRRWQHKTTNKNRMQSILHLLYMRRNTIHTLFLVA